jgi:drug/metabolite transporter (DMT)-like permease
MLVIALGFFLAFGNFAVLGAYARRGKATIVAPLVNLYPVISIGVALLLGESIGKRELIGIACALASVAALSYETQPKP